MSVKKIVAIGPESTGKSTLCLQLAEHYQTLWCPEYAREYLEKHGRDYTYDDLLTIARGQVDLEQATSYELLAMSKIQQDSQPAYRTGGLTANSSMLFIDTDMYVMKVWCEFAFGKCHSWILNQAATKKYDLYLLCNPDLPWIADELREYPDGAIRKKLYHFYKDIIVNQSVPWVDISGGYEERLKAAINAIDDLVK
jgi:NadR type nicotinamide-nucleotide adenylyltransferase